jgi:cytidylate kinase
LLIAIDGPAGSGKSSVARRVADALGFTYLDSGAMYRAVALLARSEPKRDPAELARAARIELGDGVRLDGRDVSAEIRMAEVSEAASVLAADPRVRAALVAKQRELLASGDWVAEGRDIATVVVPEAELKVFLTASAPERARRRAAELGADLQTVSVELALRDARDSSREHSPLQASADAVVLDTTELGEEEVAQRVLALARGILGR